MATGNPFLTFGVGGEAAACLSDLTVPANLATLNCASGNVVGPRRITWSEEILHPGDTPALSADLLLPPGKEPFWLDTYFEEVFKINANVLK